MIDLEKTFADISPSKEGLLYKFTDDDEEDGDIGTEIIALPSFEELFGGGVKKKTPLNQTIAQKNKLEIGIHEVMKPSEMVKELDKTVIGHPEAKKHLAVVMFKHLMERNNQLKLREMGKEMTKSNIWITGLSGSGKTLMITTLCKILKLDYILIDCASITAEGYIGNSWSDEIARIYDVCEGDEDRIDNSIIILDELDKLKSNNSENRVDVGGSEATKSLLKILEGTKIKVGKGLGFGSPKYTDTSNILFIATGTFNNADPSIEDIVRERLDKKGHKREIGFFGGNAFEEEVIHDRSEIRRNITHEDMIKYGMSVEMIGRFSDIINLDILTKEDYVKIAKLEKGGFEEYKTLFKLYGKTLIVKEDVYELLAEQMQTSEVNARGLKSLCDKVMVELVYEMVDSKKKRYTITRDMVEERLFPNKKEEGVKAI